MTGLKRTLAIDLGHKRIGLAVSDALGLTAQGLPSLIRSKGLDELQKIRDFCMEHQVSLCIVGLPLRMSGAVGDQARSVLAWVETLKERLKDVPCEVRLWDERLTSKEAQRLMVRQDLSRRKQKASSDRIAAMLILQNYMESIREGDDETS